MNVRTVYHDSTFYFYVLNNTSTLYASDDLIDFGSYSIPKDEYSVYDFNIIDDYFIFLLYDNGSIGGTRTFIIRYGSSLNGPWTDVTVPYLSGFGEGGNWYPDAYYNSKIEGGNGTYILYSRYYDGSGDYRRGAIVATDFKQSSSWKYDSRFTNMGSSTVIYTDGDGHILVDKNGDNLFHVKGTTISTALNNSGNNKTYTVFSSFDKKNWHFLEQYYSSSWPGRNAYTYDKETKVLTTDSTSGDREYTLSNVVATPDGFLGIKANNSNNEMVYSSTNVFPNDPTSLFILSMVSGTKYLIFDPSKNLYFIYDGPATTGSLDHRAYATIPFLPTISVDNAYVYIKAKE